MFGLDVEAGLPGNGNEDEGGVIARDTPNPLNEREFGDFLHRLTALHRTDPWDTEPYLYALRTLDALLPEADSVGNE